jgi:hypothetical protein
MHIAISITKEKDAPFRIAQAKKMGARKKKHSPATTMD